MESEIFDTEEQLFGGMALSKNVFKLFQLFCPCHLDSGRPPGDKIDSSLYVNK